MTLLHTLRKSTALARGVLLWWCMALGVAVASPWVHPVQHMPVCSASGSVSVQDTGLSGASASYHLNCVLCLGADAPAVSIAVLPVANAVPLLGTHPAAALAPHSLSAAPPPGRGPPRA